MIVEYVRYRVPAEQTSELVDAYRNAAPALEASANCLGYDVAASIEDPGAVTVRIEWDSIEGHLFGFRRAAEFAQFLRAVRPFLSAVEEMRHYEVQLPRPSEVRGASPRTEAGDPDHARCVVERFLAANDSLDVAGMFDEIDDEAVWAFPAAPPGAPREVSGKETNRSFFESLLPMWTSFRLPHREVHALVDDPERVVAYYTSEGTLIDGTPYRNTYLSLVTVRGGKIVHWIEFCDAEPLTRGVGTLARHEAADDGLAGSGLRAPGANRRKERAMSRTVVPRREGGRDDA